MVSQADLDRFYEDLVASVRANGGVCAITSGMACVQYGVAQATKDCDVLCATESADRLLSQLAKTVFDGANCSYRGHLTPPLDARWMRGGWTSHFEWRSSTATAHFDVFGVAPRASTPWTAEGHGLLAAMHTVAEMKRTDRPKDWPFATALGVKLLEDGDLRGWLHIFDADALRRLIVSVPCPDEMIVKRPLLRLLVDGDPRLDVAVFGETVFWQQLDRARMKVHESAVRKYLMAVKKDRDADGPDFLTQHKVRVMHAERTLPLNPLRDYGLDRLIADAHQESLRYVAPGALDWLPDIAAHFVGLA